MRGWRGNVNAVLKILCNLYGEISIIALRGIADADFDLVDRDAAEVLGNFELQGIEAVLYCAGANEVLGGKALQKAVMGGVWGKTGVEVVVKVAIVGDEGLIWHQKLGGTFVCLPFEVIFLVMVAPKVFVAMEEVVD